MNIYVVIKAGHEGIEGLLYADTNKLNAIEKVQKLRQVIMHDKAKREAVLQEFGSEEDDDYEDEWDRMLNEGKIEWDEYSNGKYEDPDAICLQMWDGKEFKCVCAELDVAPSKNWLM